MEVRQCPNCGAVNAPEAWDCYACGCTLSVNCIRIRDDIHPDFPQFIKRYQAEQDEAARLAVMLELARRFKYEAEAARFLLWASKHDPSPRVANSAEQEIVSWSKFGSGNGRKGKRLILFATKRIRKVEADPRDDPALIPFQKAIQYAGTITLISRLLDAIARTLFNMPADEISTFGLISAFLALGMLYSYAGSRESLLVSVALLAGLSVIIPLSPDAALSVGWLRLTNLGFALPVFLLLLGEPTHDKNQAGLAIYIILSLVPTVAIILTAIL